MVENNITSNLASTSLHKTDVKSSVPVIDYEGSHYKSDFWLGQGRDYEDATERLAIAELVPSQGGRIAEIGSGFGRLADLYLGYEQIILFDYSRTLLRDAVAQWGHDPRFVFVAGNIYQLPLATSILDSLVMVRVMHHLADVPRALRELSRTVHSHSIAVLEYANKRNLKALLRWLARQQSWSPFDLEPIEFVKLNFDFHPQWMEQQFDQSDFSVRRQLAVSHFRQPWLKKYVSAKRLAAFDQKIFSIGGMWPLSPSVFLQSELVATRERSPVGTDANRIFQLFRCPNCAAENFSQVELNQIVCKDCFSKFVKRDGIWDFKDPIL